MERTLGYKDPEIGIAEYTDEHNVLRERSGI
jgi:hypothetical protein